MKFVPVPSRSPRVLRRVVLETEPPMVLELIHDRVAKCNILSVGIGRGALRRVWLNEADTAKLVSSIVSLTMEKPR
jgi:hypothetical protein